MRPIPVDTILLDLDDTLIVEEPSADDAIHRACLLASARYDVHPDRLHDSLRRVARERWHATPYYPYARAIAVSSWEALWARFEGDHTAIVAMREDAPRHRQEVWRGALAAHGIRDDSLAEEMGATFIETRRGLNIVFPDVAETLAWLLPRYRVAIVTDGLSCLQRDKLRGAGLADTFPVVVAAGDTGVRKPDPTNLRVALNGLHARAETAIMVGNNPLSDVAGGAAAGVRTVWVNRQCAPAVDGIVPDAEIEDFRELIDLLS